MMKNHYQALLLIAAIVLGIIGTAGAADEPAFNATPVITNVWFARMIPTGDTYSFDILPTRYVGLNDYGRMTFITGLENVSTGDYAIIQDTQKGTQLIRVIRLTTSGNLTPEYTILTLELNKEDLPEPLVIPFGTDPNTTPVSQAASIASTTASAATATDAPAATATKAPAGMATILAGLCIAGFIGVLNQRR